MTAVHEIPGIGVYSFVESIHTTCVIIICGVLSRFLWRCLRQIGKGSDGEWTTSKHRVSLAKSISRSLAITKNSSIW